MQGLALRMISTAVLGPKPGSCVPLLPASRRGPVRHQRILFLFSRNYCAVSGDGLFPVLPGLPQKWESMRAVWTVLSAGRFETREKYLFFVPL